MDPYRSTKGNPNPIAPPPVIESLESRTLFSDASLVVTVPGPIPASAIAGAKLNDRITVNVANSGIARLTGRTTVTLYASPDGTFDNADAQLGTVTKSLNIPAGSNKNIVVKVGTLPQNLDGSYFVLANVIAPTQTAEGVSATAVAITPVHVDLGDTIVSIPTVGKLGSKIAITLNVTNDGNETAKGILGTDFGLSTGADGSHPINVGTLGTRINIKPGSSKTLRLRVSVPLGSPSGNQFIVAVIDPGDVFNDSNLINNTAVSATPVSLR